MYRTRDGFDVILVQRNTGYTHAGGIDRTDGRPGQTEDGGNEDIVRVKISLHSRIRIIPATGQRPISADNAGLVVFRLLEGLHTCCRKENPFQIVTKNGVSFLTFVPLPMTFTVEFVPFFCGGHSPTLAEFGGGRVVFRLQRRETVRKVVFGDVIQVTPFVSSPVIFGLGLHLAPGEVGTVVLGG